jgi:hypothetical protein
MNAGLAWGQQTATSQFHGPFFCGEGDNPEHGRDAPVLADIVRGVLSRRGPDLHYRDEEDRL